VKTNSNDLRTLAISELPLDISFRVDYVSEKKNHTRAHNAHPPPKQKNCREWAAGKRNPTSESITRRRQSITRHLPTTITALQNSPPSTRPFYSVESTDERGRTLVSSTLEMSRVARSGNCSSTFGFYVELLKAISAKRLLLVASDDPGLPAERTTVGGAQAPTHSFPHRLAPTGAY
jgi:hypothetical protein